MAESVSLDSRLPILVTFALNHCNSLYDKVKSDIQLKPIRDLKGELEALTSTLTLLTTTVGASTDLNLSTLKLPLLYCGLLCAKACEEFKQAVPLPFKLTNLGYKTDDFRLLLAGYETTFKIVHSDTNLRESSVRDLKSHSELVRDTAEDLLARHKHFEEKLVIESGSDTSELRLIQASLEKCLEITTILARRLEQIVSAKLEGLPRDVEITPMKTGILTRTRVDEENATKSADSSLKPQFHWKSDAPPPHSEEEAISESHQEKERLPIIERVPSPIFDELPKEHKQQRANILSKLRNEPASIDLQAYFERVKEGSSTWDIETFIEKAKCFANLSGSERDKYYGKTLKGLHYENSFAEQWNQKYPEQPITVWDREIRHQCPPSWFGGFRGGGLVLIYQGEAPLSQGLNELVKGPTTLDCGMWCQLALWMIIRSLAGDRLFDELDKFKKGQFTLTQNCYDPMNDSGTDGNLLYPFYDDPPHKETTDSSESQTRIQLRPFFNHEAYLARHPGGMALLYNVIQIDGYNIIFRPGARNILSKAELEQVLIQAYNAPRNFADEEKLWFYTKAPDFVHSYNAPKSNRTLAEEAKKYADHTLDETEWKDSQVKQEEAYGIHLIFNFQRLIRCLEETKDAYLNGAIDEDFLSRARRMKLLDEDRSTLEEVLIQIRRGSWSLRS